MYLYQKEDRFLASLKAKERHNCRSRKSDHPPFGFLNGRLPSFLRCTERGIVGNKYFRLF